MIAKARVSPEWVRSAVVYEINTRNFSASGDFQGVIDRLDDLTQLGVTVLWLMPVHPTGVLRRKGTLGSPYAVRDYHDIHSAFGTNADLKRLVKEAHGRGLRVIIDIVANHAAWDSVMMDRPEFWKQDSTGAIISPTPGWADVAGLDYQNRALRDYMIAMLVHWIREFDLDGFRCDVAGLVPTDFWNEARRALEQVKPELFLLAEWHAADLLIEAFDADYAWPFHKTLNAVFMDGAPASRLREVWAEERAALPEGALELRFSDNHDERRAIARFGERGALAASVLMFMLDGIPLLYNGQEVGDTTESGAPALFERVPIFWESAEMRPQFRPFYEKLIRLRRAHPALQQGAVVWMEGDEQILRFERREVHSRFAVAINCSNRPAGDLRAWGARVVDVSTGEVLLELPL
ncbi:MAG TPA: alpha-amylase family glycosyl hydrolase [Bryobacteraceae bacterium]